MPEAEKALSVLAEKLGVAAPYLWKNLVAYAYWDALVSLLYAPLIIAGWYFLVRAWRKAKEDDEYSDATEFKFVAMALVAAALSLITIVFLSHLPQAVISIFNPEAGAVKMLIESLKK